MSSHITGILLSVLRYVLYGFLSIAATVTTWVLSPVFALPFFVVLREWEGEDREYLIKPLRYFQTHDAPLDEWWHGVYRENNSLFARFSVEDFASSPLLRYIGRILWLCRNPAYGFAHNLFSFYEGQLSVQIFQKHFFEGRWDTDQTNLELLIEENAEGQYAWSLRGQFFFTKERYIRVWLGWKIQREDADGRRMIVTHINPFRTWKGW